MDGSMRSSTSELTRKGFIRNLLNIIIVALLVSVLFFATSPQGVKADDPLEGNEQGENPAQGDNPEQGEENGQGEGSGQGNELVSGTVLLDYECSRYGYSTLSDAEKALYDAFYNNLVDLLNSDKYTKDTWSVDEQLGKVVFSEEPNKEKLISLTGTNFTHVCEVFRADQPIFYFFGINYGYSEGEQGCFYVKPDSRYLTVAARMRVESYVDHFRTKWLGKINEIKNDGDESDNLTDDAYEIALLLHDIIINRIDYAKNGAGNPVSEMWAHNIAGVFTGEGAVCEGYAKTFKYMLDVAEIDNIYISGMGNGDSHAWNAVKIGSEWCLVDVTWDDLKCGPDSETSPAGIYDWFMSPKGAFGTKHVPYGSSVMYPLPEFKNDNELVYYVRYSSYSAEALSKDAAATFAEGAKIAAPGPYVYFVLPDDKTLLYVAEAAGSKSDGLSYILGLFGRLWIWVDEERIPTPDDDTWVYPGDENNSGNQSGSQSDSGILNGGTKKVWAGGSKDYSKITLETKLSASSYTDAKGKTKQGKLGFVVLTSDSGVSFNKTTHKVNSKSHKGIATVSNKGVVSAKAPGTVYVYAYDTGSFKTEMFTINVLAAPTKVMITKVAGSSDKRNLIKKTSLVTGDEQKFYILGTGKSGAVDAGTVYSVVLEGNADSVLIASKVQTDDEGAPFFTLTAKKPADSSKATNAKVTIVNQESGKKAKFTVVVGNPVLGLSVSGSGTLKSKGDSVELDVSYLTPYGKGTETTDGVTVKVSSSEPVVSGKKVTFNSSGSELKIKYDKRSGSLTVTAAKDITRGGGVYMALKDKGTGEFRVFLICEVDAEGKLTLGK